MLPTAVKLDGRPAARLGSQIRGTYGDATYPLHLSSTGAGDHRRLGDQCGNCRRFGVRDTRAQVDRRLSQPCHCGLPAIDQDDHCSARFCDSCRRNSPYGRRRRPRAGGSKGHRLVCPCKPDLADARIIARAHLQSGRWRGTVDSAGLGGKRRRYRRVQPQGLRHSPRAAIDYRSNGEQ